MSLYVPENSIGNGCHPSIKEVASCSISEYNINLCYVHVIQDIQGIMSLPTKLQAKCNDNSSVIPKHIFFNVENHIIYT
jgi:hypothetical protein